jgi:hypothetical protein
MLVAGFASCWCVGIELEGAKQVLSSCRACDVHLLSGILCMCYRVVSYVQHGWAPAATPLESLYGCCMLRSDDVP